MPNAPADLHGMTDLHAYPYPVHWHGPPGKALAYIDEGPPQARPTVLLHGLPTWGYVFRNVIPWLVQAGHRVLVPDLLGCGRSDKPGDPAAQGLGAQLNSLSQWVCTTPPCMAKAWEVCWHFAWPCYNPIGSTDWSWPTPAPHGIPVVAAACLPWQPSGQLGARSIL